MAQAIKYQTTTVDPTKSAGQIADACVKYGATRFEMQWDEQGRLSGLRFALRHPKWGEVPVRLKARTETIRAILQRRTSMGRERAEEQAYRIAWRQLKDYVEQALLAAETGLMPIHEVFFAQVETRDPESGELVTMGDLIERHGALQPGGGIGLLPAPKVMEADFEVMP